MTVQHAPTSTYYVSPDGDDDLPGTEAQPWRTIQKAAASLQAGETVLIRGGVYREHVVPQHAGEPQRPITFAAFPGETVTIDGADITLACDAPRLPRSPLPDHNWPGVYIGHPPHLGGLLEINGRSHIHIIGLRVINAGPRRDSAGILVKDSQHIRIENNFTHNTVSSGIGVWRCYDVIITGNEVALACNDGGQECITVAGTDKFEISHNHVHHGGPGSQGGEGIDAKHGSSNGRIHHNHVHHQNRLGIYVDSWNTLTRNIEVYQNFVHHNGGDGVTVAAEAGGLLENVKIYDNIAWKNGRSGCVVGWYGEYDHQPIRHIAIVNNTFYDNGVRDEGGGIWIENPEAENILVQNNIVSQNRLFQIALRDDVDPAQITCSHNLTDGHRHYRGEIADRLHAAPRFVQASRGNFRLTAASPARNAGLSIDWLTVDYAGHPFPQDSAPDLGAYQSQPASIPAPQGSNFRCAFPLQGSLRDYYVHLPNGCHPAEPAPLLLLLRGLESSADQLNSFDNLADRFGFIVVYPNALSTDSHAWNVGDKLNPHVDDVAFILTLLDVLTADYNIDPSRIYIAGHSSGGAMTQRLACEISDRVAAFASSAGLLARSVAEKAQRVRPVPILHIHGDADPVAPWDGQDGWLSVMEMMHFWAQTNGCTTRPFRDLHRHKDKSGPMFEYYEYFWGRPPEVMVLLLRARGGGHDWFGSCQGYDVDANVEMWRFFQDKSL